MSGDLKATLFMVGLAVCYMTAACLICAAFPHAEVLIVVIAGGLLVGWFGQGYACKRWDT